MNKMHHEKSSGDPLALGNIHPMALYINLKNEITILTIQKDELCFTYCQVPVVYSLAEQTSIELNFADGSSQSIAGNSIESELSMAIFDKKGTVSQIHVALQPGLE